METYQETSQTDLSRVLHPLEDRIAVQVMEETAERTSGGLYIPEAAREKPQQGRVVAVGPGRYEHGTLIPLGISVGDTVLFGKFSGVEISVHDEDILILRSADVLAVYTG